MIGVSYELTFSTNCFTNSSKNALRERISSFVGAVFSVQETIIIKQGRADETMIQTRIS